MAKVSAPYIGKAGKVDLDEAIFGEPFHMSLVHETVRAELAARRRGTASTRTCAEVAMTGAKAFRQWIREFYQQNKLVKGEITLRERKVDLSNISEIYVSATLTVMREEACTPFLRKTSRLDPLGHTQSCERVVGG